MSKHTKYSRAVVTVVTAISVHGAVVTAIFGSYSRCFIQYVEKRNETKRAEIDAKAKRWTDMATNKSANAFLGWLARAHT